MSSSLVTGLSLARRLRATDADERLAIGASSRGPRPAHARSDRLALEPRHGEDAGNAAREERLIGFVEVGRREPALRHREARVSGPAEDPVAGRAGEDRAGK